MKIGIDYDFTYTLDPDFWDLVIAAAHSRGHDVVCVTGRDEPPAGDERLFNPEIEIICAGDQYKKNAAAKKGHLIDVWVDDCLETIMPGTKLEW